MQGTLFDGVSSTPRKRRLSAISDADRRDRKRQERRAYKARHPDRVRASARVSSRKYKALHPDKVAAQRRSHAARHREQTAARRRRRVYGLTHDEYERLLCAQGGCCAICLTHLADRPRRPHVDHDHATGRVRGLLCHACNVGIGQLGDDPRRLVAAIAYLQRGLE